MGKSKPLAFSYTRFSSPEQAKGDSVRRQAELRDKWLAKSGAVLDTSLTLRDEGKSAFRGGHRSNPDRHALAAFLDLVKAGQVPRGSYLIVESLDRLTREHIRPALTLLLNLIDAGVRVVQLLPVETTYDESVEPMTLMMGIMELSRGHSESKVKSERVGAAWREKKKRAAADGEVLTRAVPSWLRVEGGKFVVDPVAAKAVRLIYRMATEGIGLGGITKKLNADRVPPIGRADYWARSYIAKILASRAVFGECQPHKGHVGPDRKTDGPPIPDYFPIIVTEKDWYAARAAIAGRRGKGGRAGKSINVFAGLLHDATDGGTLVRINKGSKASGPALVSYKATQGVAGSVYTSFPADAFEAAILSQLRELNPRDILPRTDRKDDDVLALTGRLADLEGRVASIKAKLVGGGDLDALVDVLRTVDADRERVAEDLATARRAAAAPLGETWGELRTLADVIEKSKDPESARVRLRAALRRIVAGIYSVFVPRGRDRLAAVRVQFSGGRHRDYLIIHHGGFGNADSKVESRWECRSFVTPGGKAGALDLRNPADAANVKRLLEKLCVDK